MASNDPSMMDKPLDWASLLNPNRRKKPTGAPSATPAVEEDDNRTAIERDADQIFFCTPVRRLGDKTQVFPLEQHDSVRNRLTHSHEVAALARSIGTRLAFGPLRDVIDPGLRPQRDLPAMLFAIRTFTILAIHRSVTKASARFNSGSSESHQPSSLMEPDYRSLCRRTF